MTAAFEGLLVISVGEVYNAASWSFSPFIIFLLLLWFWLFCNFRDLFFTGDFVAAIHQFLLTLVTFHVWFDNQ